MAWNLRPRKYTKLEIKARYRAKHREELRKKGRAYYHRVSRAAKNKRLKTRYGVTIEWYDNKVKQQNNCCAVCETPERAIQSTTGRLRPLSVDHDHENGHARDLLCTRCNAILGMLENYPDITQKLILYLRKHGKGHLFDQRQPLQTPKRLQVYCIRWRNENSARIC